MANPFGYGDLLGFSRAQIGETGLIPTQWVSEALTLAMPNVYFPLVTPLQTELETRPGQNIVVPLEGEMTDTDWPSLSEGTSIQVGSFNLDGIAVSIKEAGRGLAIERQVRQYLAEGLYPGAANRFTQKLVNNFAMSWENTLRTGIYLKGMFRMHVAAAGSVSGLENDIAGTANAGSAALDDGIVQDVYDELRGIRTGTFGTFRILPFEDGLYRWVGNWKTIKTIIRGSNYVDLQTRNQNLAGRNMIFQEIGAWSGFRWIEHSLMPDGTCIVHGRNVAVQAFGGQFDDMDIPPEALVNIQEPVPFQIRFENNWQNDFHRAKAAAWYVNAGSSAALRDIGTHCIRVHSTT